MSLTRGQLLAGQRQVNEIKGARIEVETPHPTPHCAGVGVLADDLRNRCSERLLIRLIEFAELLDDEGVLDDGDDRLDARWLEQPRSLPVSDLHRRGGTGDTHRAPSAPHARGWQRLATNTLTPEEREDLTQKLTGRVLSDLSSWLCRPPSPEADRDTLAAVQRHVTHLPPALREGVMPAVMDRVEARLREQQSLLIGIAH